MPRMKDDSNVRLADLQKRLANLVAIAHKEGREQALSEIRSVLGGATAAPRAVRRGRPPASPAPTSPRPKKAAKRRNPWATMSPEQRQERIRKMLAGRGLKPKSERGE